MIKDMKDIVSGMFDDFMNATKTVDGLYESTRFIMVSGILILLGLTFVSAVIGTLWLILVHAPWLLAVFTVVFGIPAGFLFWAKRYGKK